MLNPRRIGVPNPEAKERCQDYCQQFCTNGINCLYWEKRPVHVPWDTSQIVKDGLLHEADAKYVENSQGKKMPSAVGFQQIMTKPTVNISVCIVL